MSKSLLEKLEEIVTYHLGDSLNSSDEIADAFRQAEHSLADAFARRSTASPMRSPGGISA